MTVYTLIDEGLAKKGFSFIFNGGTKICETCGLKSVCLNNLEKQRRFVVVSVEDKSFLCPLTGKKQKLVQVDFEPVEAAVNMQNIFTNVPFNYQGINCEFVNCENYLYCNSPYLRNGEVCIILETIKEIQRCRKNYKLTLCKVLPRKFMA